MTRQPLPACKPGSKQASFVQRIVEGQDGVRLLLLEFQALDLELYAPKDLGVRFWFDFSGG
jgi:hypothetical protein